MSDQLPPRSSAIWPPVTPPALPLRAARTLRGGHRLRDPERPARRPHRRARRRQVHAVQDGPSAAPEGERTRHRFVRVLSRDVERLRIGHVMSAAISQLTNGESSGSRDSERRVAQFLTIVGPIAAKAGHHVCIMIEEAHSLPLQLLLDLKALREIEFGVNEPPLFSVVLVGHTGLRTLVETREEIHWRTLALDLRAEGRLDGPRRPLPLPRNAVRRRAPPRRPGAHRDAQRRPARPRLRRRQRMRTARDAGLPLVDHRTLPPTSTRSRAGTTSPTPTSPPWPE